MCLNPNVSNGWGVGGVGVGISVLGYSIEFIKASFVASFMPSGSEFNA